MSDDRDAACWLRDGDRDFAEPVEGRQLRDRRSERGLDACRPSVGHPKAKLVNASTRGSGLSSDFSRRRQRGGAAARVKTPCVSELEAVQMPPDALALIRRAKAEAKAAAAPPPPSPPLPTLDLTAASTMTPPTPLSGLPERVYYCPHFVSEADEATLLQHILGATASRWTPGLGRRTQNWGGRPGEKQVAEQLPDWLHQLVDALMRSGAWPVDAPPPNHVIINDYETGREGLTPHTDGPLYTDCVAVLSLMADVVIELHRPVDAAVACEPVTRLGRMLLRRRSLNVLRGDAYRCYHGFPGAERDVVDDSIVNLREAGGADGEELRRMRRISVVFVAKLT